MEEEKLRLLKEMKGEKMAFFTAFLTTWKKVNKQLLKISYHFSDFWNSYLKFAVFPYIHILYMF